MTGAGELHKLRQRQREKQMWSQIEHELIRSFRTSETIQHHLEQVQMELRAKRITPGAAAEYLLEAVQYRK